MNLSTKLSSMLHNNWRRFLRLSFSARLFLVATMLQGMFFAVWQLYFNFFILAQGYDRDFLGLVNSAPSAATWVVGIPLGMLADRLGRKTSALLGLAITLIMMTAILFAQTPNLLVLFAFLRGVGGTLFFINLAPMLAKLSGNHSRTILFSLNAGLATLTSVVGNFLAGQMPGWYQTWFSIPAGTADAYRAVLLTSVSVGLLIFLPLILIKVPGESAEERKNGEHKQPKLLEVLKNKTLWKLLIPNLGIGFGAALLVPYFNLYFSDRFNASDEMLGILFSIGALLTGFGALLTPKLAKIFGGRIRALVFCQSTSLIFLAILGLAPYLSLAAVGFMFRNALMNMANPLYESFSMDMIPENQRGTANGMIMLSWDFGWMIGPYISGLVQKNYGFSPLFLTTGILYAISILAAWIFFKDADK